MNWPGEGPSCCSNAAPRMIGRCRRAVLRWRSRSHTAPWVDNPHPSKDHSPAVSRSATIILAAALALGPMRHGSCEHCDTPVKPSCHGAGGSGEHHAAARHGPPSGERAPSCPCPAHKLCGILHADQTALSASLASHASFSGGGVTLVVAVDAASGSLRGDVRSPGGRASPSPHRPPLYLVTHSLLI